MPEDIDLGNGLMLRELPEGSYTYPKAIPVEANGYELDPFARAAERMRQGVKGRQQLPLELKQTADGSPAYLMEPDLLEAQQGQHLPTGIALNDANIPFNKLTGEEVPTVRRPNVLPVARTPDGFELAMPKMLNIVGNVIGGVAGAPAKAGEVILGSGMVRKIAEETGPFFSALEHAVDNAKVGKADAQQWLGYLKNQPGVKQEELQTVLGDIKGQLTKEQVQDVVKNNKVELKETVKGGLDYDNAVKASKDFVEKNYPHYHLDHPTYKKLVEEKFDELHNDPTKFYNYQLPGGENYKETLLSLPNKQKVGNREEVVKDLYPNKKYENLKPDERRQVDLYVKEESGIDAPEFKSSHWDEPNVIAHIRHNDRMVEGNKTLHLEEIQSDWHQKGRKEGYIQKDLEQLKKTGETIDDKLIKAKAEDIMANPDLEAGLKTAVERKIISQKEADDYLRLTKNENSTVPDAPFKKNWDELALKKILHKAANEGYEGLSWTPGEAQAARYDLSKSIDNIKLYPAKLKGLGKTAYTIEAYDKDGKKILNKWVENEKEIPDYIGKQATEKLFSGENKERLEAGAHASLENADLKIGGEGMKSFYDKMLVDKANALVKKYGSKVEQRNLKESKIGIEKTDDEFAVNDPNDPHEYLGVFKTRKEAEAFVKEEYGADISHPDNSTKIHYLPITHELRAKAKQGFPLFSSVPITVPVSHNPFETENKKYRLTPVQGNPFND